MPGMITLKIVGADAVRARLNGQARRFEDLSWFWPDVIEAFIRREQIWFGREGEGTWPPLSPTYAAWKAVHYPGKPLLQRTGALERSLTTEEAVLYDSDHMLILGSHVRYSGFHHTGTRNMPQRDPLIPRRRLAAGIARRLQEYVDYPVAIAA